jgi:hypothetical protein
LIILIDGEEDDSKELSVMVNPYTEKMLGEASGTPFYNSMDKLYIAPRSLLGTVWFQFKI